MTATDVATAPEKQRSNMYICCCAPCYVREVEGCSPVAICCWAACLCGMWPWNGIAALFYTPSKENAANPQAGLAGLTAPIAMAPVGIPPSTQNPDGSVTYHGIGGSTTVSPSFSPGRYTYTTHIGPTSPPQQKM